MNEPFGAQNLRERAKLRVRPRVRQPRFVPAVEALERRELLANSILQGTAFFDGNHNNQPDPGELPKVGATIQLRSGDGATLIDQTTTGTDGSYRFTNVAPATYRVVEMPSFTFTSQ